MDGDRGIRHLVSMCETYQHREQSNEASKPCVASENVELIPKLICQGNGEEKDNQGNQGKEVTHVHHNANPEKNYF